MAEAEDDRAAAPREPLVIRGYEPPDREALLALHRTSFVASGAASYGGTAQRFDRLLDAVHTLVAMRGGRVVGFVAFQPLDEDPRIVDWLGVVWLWARFPEHRERILALLHRRNPGRAGIDVRYVAPPTFTALAHHRPCRRDVFVTELAVEPGERRRGVATALVGELRLRLARERVPRIWATMWMANDGHGLADRVGAVPLLEISSWYRDGSATRLVLLPLTTPDADGSDVDAAATVYRGRRGPALVGPEGVAASLALLVLALTVLRSAEPLHQPVPLITLAVVIGAGTLRFFDRGQRWDRARGVRYVVHAERLEAWRGERGIASLARVPPVSVRAVTPRIDTESHVIQVCSGARSWLIGPLGTSDAILLAEELRLRWESRGADARPAWPDRGAAALLAGIAGSWAALFSVPGYDPRGQALGLPLAGLLLLYAVRRSLRWNDGSPRALKLLIAVPLIVLTSWLGLAPRLPF